MSKYHEAHRKVIETQGSVMIAMVTVTMWGITLAGLGATLPEWWTRRSDPLDNGAWLMVALCGFFTLAVTWGVDVLLARWPRLWAWRIAPSAITTAIVAALAVVGAPKGTRAGHIAFDVATAVIIVGFVVAVRSTWRARTDLPRAAARPRARIDSGASNRWLCRTPPMSTTPASGLLERDRR